MWSDKAPISTFAETAALFAVMEERTTDAHKIIDGMSAGERNHFSQQLSRLMAIVEPSDAPILTRAR